MCETLGLTPTTSPYVHKALCVLPALFLHICMHPPLSTAEQSSTKSLMSWICRLEMMWAGRNKNDQKSRASPLNWRGTWCYAKSTKCSIQFAWRQLAMFKKQVWFPVQHWHCWCSLGDVSRGLWPLWSSWNTCEITYCCPRVINWIGERV